MKLVKMSLAAAMLMGVSAFADVKVSGDAKLFYNTDNAFHGGADEADLFNKEGAEGQAAATMKVEAALDGATAKLGMTYLTTMGLEGELVNGIWAGDTLSDQLWIDELNFTFTPTEKTALVIGRQHIQTPLAFSETWNIAANSFDAAVVVNSDIPKTTLVGAFVSRGNGAPVSVVDNTDVVNGGTSDDLNIMGHYNKYGSAILEAHGLTGAATGLRSRGAYALGAVTTAIPMTTAQLWYYDVANLATAIFAQADVGIADMVNVGVQYGTMDITDRLDGVVSSVLATDVEVDNTTATALKVAFVGVENLTVSAAFSMTDEGNSPITMTNTATGATLGSQSPLFTEAWWNYGYVGLSGTTAYNITAEYSMPDVADFGLYYTMASTDNDDAVAALGGVGENDMTEITLTASKSFGAIDTGLALISTDSDDQNIDPADGESAGAYTEVQVYLTYNY